MSRTVIVNDCQGKVDQTNECYSVVNIAVLNIKPIQETEKKTKVIHFWKLQKLENSWKNINGGKKQWNPTIRQKNFMSDSEICTGEQIKFTELQPATFLKIKG